MPPDFTVKSLLRLASRYQPPLVFRVDRKREPFIHSPKDSDDSALLEFGERLFRVIDQWQETLPIQVVIGRTVNPLRFGNGKEFGQHPETPWAQTEPERFPRYNRNRLIDARRSHESSVPLKPQLPDRTPSSRRLKKASHACEMDIERLRSVARAGF